MEDQRIEYKVATDEPIELLELTNSLTCLGVHFNKFIRRNPRIPCPSDIKLYVSEVRRGSIIADLVAFAAAGAIPFTENANAAFDFVGNLRGWLDHFKGVTRSPPPDKIDRADLENMSGIVSPAAAHFNGCVMINHGAMSIHVGHADANAMQNKMRAMSEGMRPVETGTHYNKLLVIHQARNDARSKSGDKGVIESLSQFPVRMIFDCEELKERVLNGSKSPFAKLYVVDVRVETQDGIPKLYNVITIHEEIDADAPTQS